MKVGIRIARQVFDEALGDVLRPHPFALERVGFLWGRFAPAESSCLVLLNDYTLVPDDEYVDDSTVGARINGAAIRAALQRALTTGEAVFHFHVHSHNGPPGLSRTDSSELARLMPSFTAVSRAAVHGAIIGSIDSASGWVWPAHTRGAEQATSVSVIGFPTTVWRAA
jgi:hypothetical protein